MHKITKHIANVYDGDSLEDLKHLAEELVRAVHKN